MKHVKRILVLGLAISMTAMLAACGSSGSEDTDATGSTAAESAEPAADENLIPYGTYIAVSAEMGGIPVEMDEIMSDGESFTIELQENGKVQMNVEGENGKGKYTVEDAQITINIQGEEIIGTYTENAIIFEDMLGMGINMTFGLEGTDAAVPSNNLSNEASAYFGTWVSEKITNIAGEEVDLPADSMELTFADDGTVTGTFNGEALGPYDWDDSFGINIKSDDPSFFTVNVDTDSFELDYSTEAGDFYVFTMKKQ